MILKQFILESLGHASYLIGSDESGEALILDPRRDVDDYFQFARENELKISYAVDTHQHNDYLTGICELSQRSDLELLSSAGAELAYSTRPLTDGARLEMGEIVFEALHTPGHTPEHMSLLVIDRARGDEPAMLFSGGALLVGDVARPDLLGGPEETSRMARELCRTLQNKILPLPDHVEVYPTHVAGSLCGGNIASRYSTTVGYERRLNQLLARLSDQEEFVTHCVDLENLPAVPPYWRRMREQNQQGPKPLGVLAEPPALTVGHFESLRRKGAIILDCRMPEAFGGGHIPGAINVGLSSSFPTWAGSVLEPDIPYLLVLDSPSQLWRACWELLRIGYDIAQGWLAGGMTAWRTAAKPISTLPQWTVWDIQAHIAKDNGLIVLDVRQPKEWASGHIRGAMHITGAELTRRIDEIPKGRSIAVICSSGYRSSVAASVLLHHGYKNVFNVLGGLSAWQAAGLPATTE